MDAEVGLLLCRSKHYRMFQGLECSVLFRKLNHIVAIVVNVISVFVVVVVVEEWGVVKFVVVVVVIILN